MARINLLPWRDELRAQQQRQFIQQIVGVVILAGATVFGLHSYYSGKIEAQNERNQYLRTVITELNRDIQSIQQLEEERDRLIARMEVIQQLQSQRPLPVHIMDELARTLPDGIQLETVTVQNDNQISIQGFADAQARVAEYLRQINRAEHFRNASIIGTGILAREPGEEAPAGRYAFSILAAIAPVKAPEQDDQEG